MALFLICTCLRMETSNNVRHKSSDLLNRSRRSCLPDVKFSSIINLPSSDFQKIIRDLSVISDKLEIKSVGNELIFKCNGQFASAEFTELGLMEAWILYSNKTLQKLFKESFH